MTASTTIERARTLRAEHPTLPVVTVWRWARDWRDAPDWVETLADQGTAEVDGWTVALRVEDDQWPDLSWLGKWSDTWAPGAIPNPEHHEGYKAGTVCRWWIPAQTEDEHYRGLRAMKYGRTRARELARSYVIQDFRRACELVPVVATVSVSRAGIELGRASLGGIDDEAYARSWDVLGDLVDEGIDQARDALARLCQ